MVPTVKRYYLVLLWTLPADVFAWITVSLFRVLWGTPLHWVGLVLQTEFRPDSWPMNPKAFLGGWYAKWGGTNFGHGAIYRPGRTGGPGLDTSTEVHEHHHAEQVEAAMLVSFLMGWAVALGGELAPSAIYLGLAVWALGGVLYYLAAVVVALLRGEEGYRGNVLEEGAYGVDGLPIGTYQIMEAGEKLKKGDPVVFINDRALKVATDSPRLGTVEETIGTKKVYVRHEIKGKK